MPTPKIFDFDPERLADYDSNRIDQLLAEHPATYADHLAIALHISGWAERMEQRAIEKDTGEFDRGYAKALREVAAHLRQGDYAPSGAFMLDHQGERDRRSRLR